MQTNYQQWLHKAKETCHILNSCRTTSLAETGGQYNHEQNLIQAMNSSHTPVTTFWRPKAQLVVYCCFFSFSFFLNEKAFTLSRNLKNSLDWLVLLKPPECPSEIGKWQKKISQAVAQLVRDTKQSRWGLRVQDFRVLPREKDKKMLFSINCQDFKQSECGYVNLIIEYTLKGAG